MTEKRMLLIDDELLSKIDANKGEMSRIEFLSFLINNQLQEEGSTPTSNQYVSREEYIEFTQEMKDLLRKFLDSFISYDLKLGEQPKDGSFAELVQKLQSLSASGGKPKSSK